MNEKDVVIKEEYWKMMFVIVGLIGALLMFCGDITLYYTPEDFDYAPEKNKNVMQAIIEVMEKLPPKRIAAD